MEDRKTMFPFQKLESWHRAIDLATFVYRVTRSFPKDEVYGLTSQMRRAATSVASNLAEGSSRFSPADKARFTEIATGSVFELVSLGVIARTEEYLSELSRDELNAQCDTLGRMLSGLHKAQLLSK